MANIDVSELMSDPDFVDAIQLITRVPRVNGRGENVIQERAFNTYGSVQPADYRTIMKLPEAMRAENVSLFVIKGQIVGSAPGKYSSILVFKGQRYQVQKIEDWGNFGRGYTAGICVAEVPAP